MVVVCLDIRSTYNIGSILRTCDGFGIRKVYCSGLTPHTDECEQPPHVRKRWLREISKTALGAEKSVQMSYVEQNVTLIDTLIGQGYHLVALEQSEHSIPLSDFSSKSDKLAFILGSETSGIPEDVIKKCSETIEIPMFGIKESFNVAVACGICLYQIKCVNT